MVAVTPLTIRSEMLAWRSSVIMIGISDPTHDRKRETISPSASRLPIATVAPWRARRIPSKSPTSFRPSSILFQIHSKVSVVNGPEGMAMATIIGTGSKLYRTAPSKNPPIS